MDVTFQGISSGLGLQNEVAQFLNLEFLPQLEQMFDALGPDANLRIEQLNLDMGNIAFSNWQNELRMKLMDALEKELKSHQPLMPVNDSDKTAAPAPAQEDRLLQTVLFFFKNGILPWYAGTDNVNLISNWEEEMLKQPDIFMKQYLPELLQDEQTLKRFVYSVTDTFHKQIITTIKSDVWQKVIFKYIELSGSKVSVLKAFYLNASVKQFSVKHVSTETNHSRVNEMKTLLKKDLNLSDEVIILILDTIIEIDTPDSTDLNTDVEGNRTNVNPPEEKKDKHADIPSEIYIPNAGLVLLHPYLPLLFGHCGLTAENAWKDSESQMLGVLLTQYLVTGSTVFMEHDLALNKLLCGMGVTDLVNVQLELPETFTKEADNLLTQVIAHWNALGSSSISSLQVSFLQREGKLTFQDDAVHVKVDRKGWDVLLSKLPWSLSIVKNSLMKNVIYVDW